MEGAYTVTAPASTKASTKKERILTLAQRDPFLRVEEIAAKAETTPRYVRTILSEARISLMQLRRHYARTMERQLGVHVTVDRAGQGLSDALSQAGNQVGVRELHVTKVVDPALAGVLDVRRDEPLLKVSRVRLVNQRPFYVSEVITHKNLLVSEDMLSSEKPLRQLLGLEIEGETTFVDRSLEVEPAPEQIAAPLGLKAGDPVIKSGNVIVTRGERVGIEFNYFDAFRVRFVFAGASEYTLKIEEKVSSS